MSRLVQGGLLVVMLATVSMSAVVMSFFAWASIALAPDSVSADVKSVASAIAAVVVVALVLAWTKKAPVTRGDVLVASRHV